MNCARCGSEFKRPSSRSIYLHDHICQTCLPSVREIMNALKAEMRQDVLDGMLSKQFSEKYGLKEKTTARRLIKELRQSLTWREVARSRALNKEHVIDSSEPMARLSRKLPIP